MALQCGTCGGQVKDTTAKFCNHCAARMDGKSKSAATQGGAGALISPLGEGEGGGAVSVPVVCCTSHPPRKVVAFCQTCQDLVCVTCLTQKPRQHESCGEPVFLEELLTMSEPFKDQRKQVSDGRKAREILLKDLEAKKTDIETQAKAEVTKVGDMKTVALKLLDEKFEAEVEKLEADRDRQKSLVQDAAETKISRIEQSQKTIVDELRKGIDDLAADIQSLKAADHKLASSFGALTLVEQVAGSKEAQQLLNKTPAAPAPALLPSATASNEAELRRLADLTVEVTAKNLEASAIKESNVALTGPDAVFAVGSRVVMAPGYSCYGGPGTVTAVGNGTANVRWDRTGHHVTHTYYIGRNGEYQLQLVKPS